MKGHYLAILGLLVLVNLHFGQGHRCYVCAPNTRKYADIQELKKMFGNVKIPKCSHYHRYRMKEFIQECPKESRGCVTQFEDGSILRTCATVGIDDCKVANDVTYCYCKNELCNNPGRKLSTPGSGIAASPHEVRDLQIVNTAHVGEDEYADEDYSHEGSGYDDYYGFLDGESDADYGPESEDQTEPPLFITDETDLYKRPTAPPLGDKDDFGFVEDNKLTNFQSNFNTQLHKNNPNAKSSQHLNPKVLNSSTCLHKCTEFWLFLTATTLLLLTL